MTRSRGGLGSHLWSCQFQEEGWATISPMQSADNRLIRLIALFKLLKAVLLIAVGMSALHLIHKDVASVVEHWVKLLGLDPDNRYIDMALQKVGNLTPAQIKRFGIGSFIYAGLFLTEGIGLWLVKRWAEWFSVIITSSLLPLEVYGIYRHPGPIKILVLILNIAVVGYLIDRIRKERP
jgi:uncharacterized membrane protein (DUF2068 family)